MRVEDRFGQRWRVRRRWLPWRRRIREVPDLPTDVDVLDDPLGAIVLLFLLVLAIPVLLVLVVLLAELLLLLALLPLVLVVRTLLPVPWIVEVWARPAQRRVLGWHLEHEVPVRGLRASGRRVHEIVREIATEDHGGRYVPADARPRPDPED